MGNLSTITHHNGNVEAYSYDKSNRLIKLDHRDNTGKTIASFSYTLSPIGERLEIAEENRTTKYTYDALSKLLKEEITDTKNGDHISTYSYDENQRKPKGSGDANVVMLMLPNREI